MFLISIIIPFYDKDHHYIPNMLNYLSKLSFNKEVIFIDDRNDKSLDIRSEYNVPNEYKIINSSINGENIGTFESRRTGTLNATGEYIWFVDVDDEPLDIDLEIDENNLMDVYAFNVKLINRETNEVDFRFNNLSTSLTQNKKNKSIKLFFNNENNVYKEIFILNKFARIIQEYTLCNKLFKTKILKGAFNNIQTIKNFTLSEDHFILLIFVKELLKQKRIIIELINEINYVYHHENNYKYSKDLHKYFNKKTISITNNIFKQYFDIILY